MDVSDILKRNESLTSNINTMQALLDQVAANDPRLQMIMEFMRSQNAQQTESPSNEERQARVKRVKAKYEQLKYENAILKERNDLLASALGACPACWGEDQECGKCDGKGTPGAYSPDKEAFADYVLPVVRRLRQSMHTVRNAPSETTTAIGTQTNGNGKHTIMH